MHSPLASRYHLWLWGVLGVFLYVASCPPVEAWYEKRGSSPASVPVAPATMPPSPRPGAQVSGGEFLVTEVSFHPPAGPPRWVQIFYAPVHWVAQYPPFGTLYNHYWKWCYERM